MSAPDQLPVVPSRNEDRGTCSMACKMAGSPSSWSRARQAFLRFGESLVQRASPLADAIAFQAVMTGSHC